MVSKSLMVFSANFQLFLLWWKSLWLLWRSLQPSTVTSLPHHLSSIHFILSLLHRIRMVCVVVSQKVLHETVQLVCLDTCSFADCRHSKLFDHSEYFWRWDIFANSWFYRNSLIEFVFRIGMIWFIVPVMMIVCNDVMAYMFGFFFGKTPLIKLSPKKTWEGFIGGGIATVIFGVVFSYFLCQYQFFVCPIQYSETAGKTVLDCEPSYLFRPQEYGIRIVRKKTHTISINNFFILFLGKNWNCLYDVSIFTTFLITKLVQLRYRTFWWFLCFWIQACIQN